MSTEQVNQMSEVYEKDQVIKIINSVIAKVSDASGSHSDKIFKELNELQSIIEQARAEIGATRPSDINEKHIPTATDELDAVVEATAEATGKIMDSCDLVIEKAAETDQGDAITAEVMKIYEACSFQDITGQRITKVVTTLKTIEEKVANLVAVLSDSMPGLAENGDVIKEGDGEEDQGQGDEALLNGPQMPDKAITQDDIDALLAEFD